MNKNLTKYVLTAESIVPTKLCKDLIKEINKGKTNWIQHTWHNRISDDSNLSLSGKNELYNYYLENENANELNKILWSVIYGYVKHFKFNWFDSFAGYTFPRFNIYKKNLKMANHCDHIATIFDGNRKGVPILSVLGVLNDNYQGGEFIMFEDMEFKMKQGDVLVFPSNFLYPHKVEPVTKGTRHSFISWVW